MSSTPTKSHVPEAEKIAWGTWLCLLPVLALPALLTLRLLPMVAPNEEPKWGVFVLIGLILGVGLTLRWLANSTPIPRPSLVALGITSFLLLLGMGICIAPNPIEGVIRGSFWLFGLFVGLAGVVLGRSTRPLLRQLTLWGVALASLWFCWRYLWMYRFAYGQPGYNDTVLFSPIGHVNFTADVLVLLIPWLALLTMVRGWGLALAGWIGAVGCSVILLLGASRGGLLGVASGLLAAGTVWAAGRWWRRHLTTTATLNRTHFFRLGALLTIPVVAWLIYQQSPYRYRELDRVGRTLEQAVTGARSVIEADANPHEGLAAPQAPVTTTPSGSPTAVQQAQSDPRLPPWAPLWDRLRPFLNNDRTGMYASALGMTFDAPWVGHGTGNFPFIYPTFSHRYPGYEDRLSGPTTYTTNPHNIFLQIATENGIPAALLFITLWLGLSYRVLRALFQQDDPLLVAGGAFVVGALVDGMVNHVFYNPASLFVAMLLGGWLWGRTAQDEPASAPLALPLALHLPLRRWGGYTAILVLFVLAVWPSRWLLSQRDIAWAMSYPNGSTQAAEYYHHAYEWDPYNFRAVFGLGVAMAQQQRWEEALGLIDYFVRIAPNNPQGWHILGSLYAQTGRFPESAAALEHALDLMPNYTPARVLLNELSTFLATQGSPPTSR